MDEEPLCGGATANSNLFIYVFIYLFIFYLFIYYLFNICKYPLFQEWSGIKMLGFAPEDKLDTKEIHHAFQFWSHIWTVMTAVISSEWNELQNWTWNFKKALMGIANENSTMNNKGKEYIIT